MRRLLAVATILPLGLLAGLPALAGPRPTSTPRPATSTRPVVRPNPFIPHGTLLPRNYLPRKGMRITTAHHHYTLTFNTDIGKVRTMNPPEAFDEKGNIRKHTKEELRALKGDDPAEKKMVGYKADFADLQVGDVVQLTISANKDNLQKGNKKDKADADLEKNAQKGKSKWQAVTEALGTVTKVQQGNTESGPTFTVRVTSQAVTVGKRNNTIRRNHTIKPEDGQVSLIVVHQTKPAGDAAPGGKRGKKEKE
jgi:hypothetical protein